VTAAGGADCLRNSFGTGWKPMLAQNVDTTSPFLPGTKIQYAWDSTSLGWLKACPRQYYYYMIEGYRPKGDQVNLTFGIYYHEALEQYDRLRAEGWNHEPALFEVVTRLMMDERLFAWRPDNTSKNRHTLLRSVIWYLDEFREDALKTVTLANGKPAVELSFRMQLDWGPTGHLGEAPYILCGHLDRIVEFSGGTYVSDRKTTGTTISSSWFERFDLDNQMSLYTIAASVIFHTPVKGVIVDGAQVAVGFTRFARGMTYRTPAQTSEWLGDLKYWLAQAEGFAEAGYWPMNEKACFLCAFKRVCSRDPAVRQMFLESDYEVKPWNPLQVR
jgi:PD-(D/E)XK nuclease superfamily